MRWTDEQAAAPEELGSLKTTRIGHPAQSHGEFQQELRELGRLVTRYGIDACQPKDGDRIAMAVFINKVHEGWKQAQNVAIRLYFEISDEIETVKDLIKACNRTRQREGLAQFKESLKVLEYRKRKVQHAVDAIVWSVYQNKDWVLRRFWLDGAHTNIGRYELLQTMQVADELNRVATKLAIACDLTTFMKVGDLVLLDLMNKEMPLAVAEVKAGEVNAKCVHVLENFRQFGCPRQLAYATENFSDNEQGQLARMLRQEARMAEITHVLEHDHGIDSSTGHKLVLNSDEIVIDTYEDELTRMYDELQGDKVWAIASISDCLHLGLYKTPRGAQVFNGWMDGIEARGPRLNYGFSVVMCEIAQPTLAAFLPSELAIALYADDLLLMMCLDVPRWLQEVNTQGHVEVRMESVKQSRRLKAKFSDMFFHEEQCVALGRSGVTTHLGNGTLGKILFKFYDPVDLLSKFPDVPAPDDADERPKTESQATETGGVGRNEG